MKNVKAVQCALLFVFAVVSVSTAGFAQTPDPIPLTNEALAAILGQPPTGGSCETQPAPVLLAACNATANCGSSPPVSCSGSSSCTTVDSNCSTLQAGYVRCDGVTTWCGPCCPSGDSCCQCSYTGDCFQCCRCAGGSPHGCVNECG